MDFQIDTSSNQMVNFAAMAALNVLFLVLMTFCNDSNVEIEKYKQEIEQLRKKNEQDIEDYNQLLSDNNKDIDDYNDLLEKYNKLERENEKTIEDYNDLVDECTGLKETLEWLREKNNTDITDYNGLAELYNALLDENESQDSRISRLESRLNRNIKYKA